jgi:hypothetical protein
MFMHEIADHAPAKVMAKQWLQMYQKGPYWVLPTVLGGTVSNAILAYLATQSSQRVAYVLAAASIWSILPMTFLYFEPGINGACKWKVESILKDEGFSMPESTRILPPSTVKHSATESAKKWAARTSLKELVEFWGKVNHVRWVVALAAAAASGYATLKF